MSRISKEIASNIANKLVEKSNIATRQLRNEYEEMVTVAYEAQIPEEVKNCFDKNPDWVIKTGNVRFSGFGFQYESVSTTRRVPSNYSDYHGNLEINAKLGDKFMKAKREYEKSKEELKKLRDETEIALLTLKTYNNIRKELPEAAPYLPPPLSNSLVVNFDSLKHRLNRQPEVTNKVIV